MKNVSNKYFFAQNRLLLLNYFSLAGIGTAIVLRFFGSHRWSILVGGLAIATFTISLANYELLDGQICAFGSRVGRSISRDKNPISFWTSVILYHATAMGFAAGACWYFFRGQ